MTAGPTVPFAPPPPDLPTGRRVLATFDAASVVVWQAHRADVADAAVATHRFACASWRTDRISRMRLSLPSLLARSQWGTRPGRERILAVRLRRAGFDEILRRAVPAENDPAVYASDTAWRLATRFATVTLSWHPDLDLTGQVLPRETPRIGLRDHALRSFQDWVVGVEDFTDWVAAHRGHAAAATPVPVLEPYPTEGLLGAFGSAS